jgi:hypothetical protein
MSDCYNAIQCLHNGGKGLGLVCGECRKEIQADELADEIAYKKLKKTDKIKYRIGVALGVTPAIIIIILLAI